MLLYISIAIITLSLSWLLFRAAAGSMSPRRLNIISWTFYVQFLGMTFIGATLGVLGVSHYVLDVVDDRYRVQGFAAVCYVMIATPLAMVLVQRFLLGGRVRTKLRSYYAAPLTISEGQIIWWFLIWLVAVLATIYVYITIRRVPFLTFLTAGSAFDLAVERTEAKRLFSGNVYVKNLLSLGLTPLISFVAFAYASYYRRPRYTLWFLATFVVAATALTYSGEKSPVILYVGSLFFVRGFLRGGIRWAGLVAFGLVGLLLMVVTYVVFNKTPLSVELFQGMARRVFISQYAGVPVTFAVFPYDVPFLKGASMPEWFASMMGLEHVISSRLLMEMLWPQRVAAGTVGVMNTLFVAEAWANFGWVGLLLSPLWVGTLFQLIHNALLVAPKTPATVALMTFFMTALPVTGGVVAFLWNPLILFVLLLSLLVTLLFYKNGTIYLRIRFRIRRAPLSLLAPRRPYSPSPTALYGDRIDAAPSPTPDL